MFVGKTLGRIGALVGQILIVRALDPAVFGVLALSYTLTLVSGRLVSNGFREGVTRAISVGSEDQRHEQFLAGLALALPLSIIAVAIFAGLRADIAVLLSDPELAGVLLLFIPFLIIYPLSHLCLAEFRGRKDAVLPVISEHIIGTAAAIGIFLLLSALGHNRLAAVAYWYTTPVVVVVFLGSLLIKRDISQFRAAGLPAWSSVQALWSYSWPLLLGSSLALFLSNTDILMIGYFANTTSVGEYRSIQPLQQVTLFLLSSIAFVYLPVATELFNENHYEDLGNLYKTTTKWVIAGTTPLVLVFILFADDIVIAFYGAEYLAAAPALSLLIAGVFLQTFVGPSGIMLKAINQPRLEAVAAAIGFVVNVVLNALLIPQYGIVGAAIGTAIGIAVFNGIEAIAVYFVVGATPFSVAEVKQVIPTIVVAVTVATALDSRMLGLPALILVSMGFAAVQFASVFLTRSLSSDDLELVEAIEDQGEIDLSLAKRTIRQFS